MALTYTADDLVDDAKLRAFLPDSNTSPTSLSDDDIIRLANDELWGSITSKMQAAVSEYFIVEYPFPYVPPQVAFDIPPRAQGGTLRDVYVIPQGGTIFQRTKLSRIDATQIQAGVPVAQQPNNPYGPESFWLQANQVVIYPTPNQPATLVISVFFRPSQLVFTSACCQIQSINFSTGVVTLTGTAPAGYTTTTLVDFVRAQPGFDPLIFDISINAVPAVNQLTFDPTILVTQQSRIHNGDYIAIAGTAPVPQIPLSIWPLLAARTALRICRATGDQENGQVLAQDVADMEATFWEQVEDRVEGKQMIMPMNELIGYARPKWLIGSF